MNMENAPMDYRDKEQLLILYKELRKEIEDVMEPTDFYYLKKYFQMLAAANKLNRDSYGFNPLIRVLRTSLILVKEIGVKRAPIMSILLKESVIGGMLSISEVEKMFGSEIALILKSLVRIDELYQKNPDIESENFRDMLLSFADDVRVIIIMTADRVNLMRLLDKCPENRYRIEIARETAFIYAPLAHRMGLYIIKSELEDLWLKFTNPKVYYDISRKLNETKAERDKYIDTFIKPVREKLEQAELKFTIKGRIKSIYSINNKMVKQKSAFEQIYDLFAIRIIIDSLPEEEKRQCWQAYSIVTDMYQPNPNRLRDWLSIPKRNGYESLHTTVMGPEGKWVEVQIRTARMDQVAERGVAAHWRYKGVKSQKGVDELLSGLRETLEDSRDSQESINQFKIELYREEVFIFTPKGDLFKLPQGATVLDFAFSIHSKVGSTCVGARVNGKNARISQKLRSGDQVEIFTSANQTPKAGWLDVATTSRARTKIRQSLKEIASRQAVFAREELARRFKNHKIEVDGSNFMRLIKKMGYKEVTDFYQSIAEGAIDSSWVIEQYINTYIKESEREIPQQKAEEFTHNPNIESSESQIDELVIDGGLKGVDYRLGRCCNPVYGDSVFGFVTLGGGITVHRLDCSNAPHLNRRYPYRVVKARWAGKGAGKLYPISLSVIGNDEISIVSNITSIISKEPNISMRSIDIKSNAGLFTGFITVMIDDIAKLDSLLKKIGSVKGVKQISRT